MNDDLAAQAAALKALEDEYGVLLDDLNDPKTKTDMDAFRAKRDELAETRTNYRKAREAAPPQPVAEGDAVVSLGRES